MADILTEDQCAILRKIYNTPKRDALIAKMVRIKGLADKGWEPVYGDKVVSPNGDEFYNRVRHIATGKTYAKGQRLRIGVYTDNYNYKQAATV